MATRKRNQRKHSEHPPHESVAPVDTPALDYCPAPLPLRIVLPILVAVGAFLPFLPALDAGFVNWDDDKVILNNTHIRGLTSRNIDWMFTESKMGHYHPLTWLSYAVDFAISQARYPKLDETAQARYNTGFDPWIVHLNNLIIHAAVAVAVYFFIRLLLRIALPPPPERPDIAAPIIAAVAALLFAAHPLRVESVAWVTERRDVLSGLFFVGCLTCYLRYAIEPRSTGVKIAWYLAAVLVLLLSLFSKAWGITIVAVLLVMDVYPLRRIGGARGWISTSAFRVYADKLPFVTLSVIFAALAKKAQGSALDTLKTLDEWGIADRVAQAIYGLFFYSYKTFVPSDLTPLVPLPVYNNPLAMRFVIAAIVLVAIAVTLILLRKRWPAGLALAICYTAILSPVLGIAQSGPQLVADKYSYLGCLVWPMLAAGALLWLWRKRPHVAWTRTAAPAATALALMLCGTFAFLTWRQTQVWHDSRSLWEHAVEIDPRCVLCQSNLGLLERQSGRVDEAIRHYRAAYEVDPEDPVVLNNLAVALREDPQHTEEAIDLLRKAVELSPAYPDLRYSLARALEDAGHLDEALEHFKAAVHLKSGVPKFHRGLAQLHFTRGELDAARKQYERALELDRRLDPRSLGVIHNLDRLARIALRQNQPDLAAQRFREILDIDPDNGPALRGLAQLEKPNQ